MLIHHNMAVVRRRVWNSPKEPWMPHGATSPFLIVSQRLVSRTAHPLGAQYRWQVNVGSESHVFKEIRCSKAVLRL